MRGISPEKRKLIVHKWCTIPNITLKQLAKTVEVSIGAVRTAIRKYGEDFTFYDAPKSGRKTGPTDRNLDRKIAQAFRRKPDLSVKDVAKNYEHRQVLSNEPKQELVLKHIKNRKNQNEAISRSHA